MHPRCRYRCRLDLPSHAVPTSPVGPRTRPEQPPVSQRPFVCTMGTFDTRAGNLSHVARGPPRVRRGNGAPVAGPGLHPRAARPVARRGRLRPFAATTRRGVAPPHPPPPRASRPTCRPRCPRRCPWRHGIPPRSRRRLHCRRRARQGGRTRRLTDAAAVLVSDGRGTCEIGAVGMRGGALLHYQAPMPQAPMTPGRRGPRPPWPPEISPFAGRVRGLPTHGPSDALHRHRGRNRDHPAIPRTPPAPFLPRRVEDTRGRHSRSSKATASWRSAVGARRMPNGLRAPSSRRRRGGRDAAKPLRRRVTTLNTCAAPSSPRGCPPRRRAVRAVADEPGCPRRTSVAARLCRPRRHRPGPRRLRIALAPM